MKLSQLKRNERNPRLIRDANFDRLKKSITEFGAVMMPLRPMVYDADNVIIGSNMRHAACLALGMKEVPDDWVKFAGDLTEEQKREFVVKDNSNFGEYDWSILANQFDDLPLSDWGVDIPDDWAGEGNDPNAEWQGMPEFEQDDLGAWKTIKVHFENEHDLKEFAKRIGQTVTDKTRYIWFPFKPNAKLKELEYAES